MAAALDRFISLVAFPPNRSSISRSLSKDSLHRLVRFLIDQIIYRL
jgi:hypothetical protein